MSLKNRLISKLQNKSRLNAINKSVSGLQDTSKLKDILNKSQSKLDGRLILILMVYVIGGFLLLGYYQHQINPDGVGYIETAMGYLGGHLYSEVNAYWGPLLSWLLMPFLFFNQTPGYALYSTKLLSLVVGFFTIIGIRQLSYRFEMDEAIRSTILLVMVPIMLYFSLSVITPDLLIVCILVYYLAIIFNPVYPEKLSNGLLCGILGAVAYLGKSFIFPFFLVHFLVFNLFHYFKGVDPKKRKKILKNLTLGLLTFLMISGVWVGLISSKEGKLTFGTAGEYNHALVGPQSIGYPQLSQGLSGPGEINQEQAVKSWSPFESWNNFQFQLKLIWNNTLQTLAIYQYYSYLSLIILISYLLLLTLPFKKLYVPENMRETVLYSLVTIIIFSGGYLPILVEERYLWFVYVLLILMGGYLINLMFKIDLLNRSNSKNLIKGTILIIFAVSFIFMPLNFLIHNLSTGKDIYGLSNTLKSQYGVHGNIATNDRLIDTQYISFYLKTTSYGQAKKNIDDNQLELQLKKYNIDYYLVWGDSTPHLLPGYGEITTDKINDLRIYSKI